MVRCVYYISLDPPSWLLASLLLLVLLVLCSYSYLGLLFAPTPTPTWLYWIFNAAIGKGRFRLLWDTRAQLATRLSVLSSRKRSDFVWWRGPRCPLILIKVSPYFYRPRKELIFDARIFYASCSLSHVKVSNHAQSVWEIRWLIPIRCQEKIIVNGRVQWLSFWMDLHQDFFHGFSLIARNKTFRFFLRYHSMD